MKVRRSTTELNLSNFEVAENLAIYSKRNFLQNLSENYLKTQFSQGSIDEIFHYWQFQTYMGAY